MHNLSLFINYFIVSYNGDLKTVIRHEMGENGLKKVNRTVLLKINEYNYLHVYILM